MKAEYDVVVIGSGYGGSVAASRMARVGKQVVILELGLERWPGEYPTNLKEAAREFHWSGAKDFENTTHGRPTGLYHVIKGDGQNVFVANGLGGTSLVNANVFLRADLRSLGLGEWPRDIREDPYSLNAYYARAESMLQPSSYPSSYPTPSKLSVFEEQAAITGQHANFYRVPQTTVFRDGLNSSGVGMNASTGSGQDMTGVNDGSKNSVLMNYIPDAWNHGAEIFCECEVRHVEKDPSGNGYIVFFVWRGAGREKLKRQFDEQLMWVRAREFVFMGAGAMGTTEILLRSKARGLSISPLVGQKISGNGDKLSFGYNTERIVNGVGRDSHPPGTLPCGPTITGVIDNRGSRASPNVLDAHVIQEGAIPEAASPLIQYLLDQCPSKSPPTKWNMLKRLIARLRTMLFGSYALGSSINTTITYLVMSHDHNEAIMTLHNDQPKLQFLGRERHTHAKYLQGVLTKMTHAIGGTFIDASPETTVHPLGGARMAYDGTGRTGAVNSTGQLFCDVGANVHEGIICVDASVVPRSLAVNPMATITALAERTCDLLIKKNGWTVDESPNGKLNLYGKPAKVAPISNDVVENSSILQQSDGQDGIRFSEVMEGSMYIGDDIIDFDITDSVARGASSTARLFITVHVPSVEKLTNVSVYAAMVTGTLSCGAISQHPLLITKGRLQFFVTDDTVSDATNIKYKLKVASTNGETFLVEGRKKIDSRMSFSILQAWKATTNLYMTIQRPDGSIIGRGILRISLSNFINELRTIEPDEDNAPSQKLYAPARFVYFFATNVLKYIFSPIRALDYPNDSRTGFLRKPMPRITTITAQDGVVTTMKIWDPLPDTPKHIMPILLIPGASVDDQIFSCPTIHTNTIDYFTTLGYRCYVSIPRFGINEVAKQGWTCYDARWDIKAAMEYVREQENGRKFYAIVHCLGSISTSIALLTGVVNAEWMAGMTSSQVFCDLRFSKDNVLKAKTPTLANLYRSIAGPWLDLHSSPSSPQPQFLLDQLLRFYPVGPTREICNSTVCHRDSLVFGRCFTHANLNHATHAHLASYFSGIHMNFLTHLMTMGARAPHHVRSNLNPRPNSPPPPISSDTSFADLVTPPNIQRLAGLKIQFVSGGASAVYDPLSTATTYGELRDRFGSEGYERVVLEGYGHLDTWMGRESVGDVFPRVRGWVERCEKGGEEGSVGIMEGKEGKGWFGGWGNR
ncbi:FAD/NAD(P)-binding domain-containing protein [Polyplosphaeria fusca]|uniref:Cholesterol oxidase n=1 Tax=Polyplosphaeria fusca TaxID=682080 RepID=A0A9P4R3Q1_9PLEO|nr:FAD/NAD(P)-binding domain-containing protein [Polyplosphaeria fusca]